MRRTIIDKDGKKIFRNRYRLTDIRKDYTSMNEYCRLAGVDLLKNRVDLCTYIGASVMVLHMQLPWKLFAESEKDKEDYYTQVCKSFDELALSSIIIGLELIKSPFMDNYSPYFVIYPLWKEDIKTSLDYPILLKAFKNKKGFQYDILFEKHSVFFNDVLDSVKKQSLPH